MLTAQLHCRHLRDLDYRSARLRVNSLLRSTRTRSLLLRGLSQTSVARAKIIYSRLPSCKQSARLQTIPCRRVIIRVVMHGGAQFSTNGIGEGVKTYRIMIFFKIDLSNHLFSVTYNGKRESRIQYIFISY